jgi:hypothetical protein
MVKLDIELLVTGAEVDNEVVSAITDGAGALLVPPPPPPQLASRKVTDKRPASRILPVLNDIGIPS